MILTYNGLANLKACLDSANLSTYPNLDVYVIDDGGSDGSSKFVTSNYPHAKLIRLDSNVGFATAYDTAVKVVKADYVVLLNDDTQVAKGFVQELVEKAESNENVGSVGCKVVALEESRRYGPVFFTGNGLFIGPLFFGSTIGKRALYSIYETDTECVASSAAAVLYRKPLIDLIGLFDSDYWADWEDHDLGFRICLAGYRNLYTPRTRALHKGAATYGSVDSRERVIRTIRNMLFTYVKNYEARNIVVRFFPLLFGIIPYRELIVILENEVALLCGSDSDRRKEIRRTYMSFPEAYWRFIVGLRRTLEKRQIVQSHRRTADADIIQRTSKHLI